MSDKKSTKKFIKRAIDVHKDVYDYSKVKYSNANTPVIIQCSIHGEFLQRPYLHINRQSGCPECAYIQRATTRKNGLNWLTYEEAKRVIRSLHLTNISEWNILCSTNQCPVNIPSSPRTVYAAEWKGWEDWIGVNAKNKQFVSFKDSRKIVQKFNLRSMEDWNHFCAIGNRPADIPFFPKQVYSDEWVSWGDWLGYSSRANGNLPGIIYILQYGDTPPDVYKIGRTYRLDKRIYEHSRVNDVAIKVIDSFEVDNMNIAEQIAHSIATTFGNHYQYRRSKEHFQISDIGKVIDQFNKVL